jgi:hypothetical protein
VLVFADEPQFELLLHLRYFVLGADHSGDVAALALCRRANRHCGIDSPVRRPSASTIALKLATAPRDAPSKEVRRGIRGNRREEPSTPLSELISNGGQKRHCLDDPLGENDSRALPDHLIALTKEPTAATDQSVA